MLVEQSRRVQVVSNNSSAQREGWLVARVGDVCAADASKWRKSAGLAVRTVYDVLNPNAATQEGVGDERAVASPWHRLGAHQSATFRCGEFDGAIETRLKLRRLHVIREPSETRIAPAQVGRIGPTATEPTEDFEMCVTDAGRAQRRRKGFARELRIVAGRRDRTALEDPLDMVQPEQAYEPVQRSCRVSDRKDGQLGLGLVPLHSLPHDSRGFRC